MLVLTRKDQESIRIGHDIIVQVVGIQGGKIRLGITAPPDVPVLRSELEGQPALLPKNPTKRVPQAA